MNIEGTDFLLVVMPEDERTPGKVKAYLIPTKVAVKASRSSHQAWLDAAETKTKGDNKTFCLWFRKNGKTSMSSDYETKWAEYRLAGEAYTDVLNTAGAGGAGGFGGGGAAPVGGASDGSVKAEVEMARQRISKAAGVSPDAVRITIQFGA